MTIDEVYVSASGPNPVFANAVSSLEDSSIRQEGDDGTVTVIGRWPRRRRQWQVTWGNTSVSTIETLFAVNGHTIGFLFVPTRLADYQATAESIGTGDGTTTVFQLKRTLDTGARTLPINVKYPLSSALTPSRASADTIHVYLDGVESPAADWTLGAFGTGTITFDVAPAAGVAITATFQYATPVSWLSDSIDTTMLEGDDINEVRGATLVEVF